MRVIVTGGAGFIGSTLCRLLVPQGWDVLCLDKLTYAGSMSSLKDVVQAPNFEFVQGDICDHSLVQALFDRFAPDGVIHLAAESHVDRSIAGAAAFIETNIVGTYTLLERSRAYWQTLPMTRQSSFRFLHVSTDEVFGSLGPTSQFNESTPYDPRSPYSASKAASDHLVRAWGHTHKLPILVTNCSNNYGSYQFPEKLIPLVILNALQGKAIPVYGDGAHIRDWLHVEDHARALQSVMERGRVGETYCIGGRSERTNLSVVEGICDLLDQHAPSLGHARRELIRFVADRPGHDRRYAIDSAKIEREVGWRPRIDFSEGLAATVAWYVAREDWWGPIRAGRYGGERLGLPTQPHDQTN